MNTNDDYYLGREFDSQSGKTSNRPLLYDPNDLTTHAVVVGMTGSGKTGLCLDLLEEAALKQLPALMLDPKGDITNALLHFPNLAPNDFLPWLNADQARRDGKTIEQAAADTATMWRNGLHSWDIGPDRIRKLDESVQYSIYTPGSEAGIPVSILASLKAPNISWQENRELLREKISGTITAILGLTGMQDIDPVRSREHILLANIFEQSWSQGKDLDLGELIMQTQSPPFEKLGIFDVNTFFPEKDRFELAMTLNNILASPAFQSWIEGQPLDIHSLLYTQDGRPRHSVFYIAHLNDQERMFFVSLLFSAVETWMRTQSGSNSLRALIYFDEIFGYLPPVGNPPSKETMLRMLKQARAFGVGLVLATQNPVDIDYKALSNAGTWFIGKLQTDQDKQRLLDGLVGAVGGLDRSQYDTLISSLGKRVFLLHNVHEKQPILFQTRWAMNYLAGPLTRAQIPALNVMANAEITTPVTSKPAHPVSVPTEPLIEPTAPQLGEVREKPPIEIGLKTRPTVPRQIMEYFLPNNLSLTQSAKASERTLPSTARSLGLLYRPVLLAQVDVRFLNRKYDLNSLKQCSILVHEPDRRGMVHWDDYQTKPIKPSELDHQPAPGAYFEALVEPFSDSSMIRSMERDFQDWAYRTITVTVKANEKLAVFAGPETAQDEFLKMCKDAADEQCKQESQKVDAAYDKKIDRALDKLKREERELEEDEAEHAQRKREEGLSHAETVLSLFSRRRRSLSSSLTKRRLTDKARADVEESIEAIEELEAEIEELKNEEEKALEEIAKEWEVVAEDITEIPISPYKKDVNVAMFGVAWFPYHIIEDQVQTIELPGFEVKLIG